MRELEGIEKRILALAPEQEADVRLGIRWFQASSTDIQLDAFLAIWFAIEAIGMSDSNVRPLHAALAVIYGESEQAAKGEISAWEDPGFS